MPCGIEKLLLFQPSDCSVWSCRLFWGLPENQSDYKDFVWPFKAMSKRQKQTSVLCSASSLLGIREKWCIRATVGVCVGEGVCKCVCRGGRELTGKHRNIADSVSVCGGEEIRVKNMNTLAPHHCSYYKKLNKTNWNAPKKRERWKGVCITGNVTCVRTTRVVRSARLCPLQGVSWTCGCFWTTR